VAEQAAQWHMCPRALDTHGPSEAEAERRHSLRDLVDVAGHYTVLGERDVLLAILVKDQQQLDGVDVDVDVDVDVGGLVAASRHPDMLLAEAAIVGHLELHLDDGHIGQQDMAQTLGAGLGSALSENLTLAGRDTRPRRARS
jgi:hypothetical protein